MSKPGVYQTTENGLERIGDIPADHPAANPMEMVARALDKGIDGPMLQQFMDLQERYEANEARKAYADAMAKCQKAMPAIQARAANDQTDSVYAKLEHINAAITPIYTKHGFSISFGEQPLDGDQIRIYARVLHKMGHAEEYTFDLDLDQKGLRGNDNKTAIHAKGSSITYARRYLTTMIFNLTVGDDVDGNLPGDAGRITEEQALEIDAMISENGINHDAFKRSIKVLEYNQIPAAKFEKAKERAQQIIDNRKGTA